MGSLADVFVKIRGDTTLLKTDTKKGAEDAGRTAGQSFGSSFTSMLKSAVATGGALLAGMGLVNLGRDAIKTAADMQQATVAFTTLTGSVTTAQKFLSDLKQFAASTPFELPGLVDDARLLMGVGVAARDVIPTLTAWGNAAGALGISGARFDRAMLALSQSLSAGTIKAGDMNQIIEAGIPIWRLMAEATGKPVTELKKLGEQGKLLSADILPKVQAQMMKDYGGAMAAQSKTLTGVWSTFMDTLHIGMADSLEPLIPLMSKAIPGAADILSKGLGAASAGVADFIKMFGKGWKEGADGATGTAQQLGNVLHGAFDWLRTDGVRIVHAFADALGDTVDAIASMVRWLNEHRNVATALLATMAALVVITKAHAVVMAVEAAGGVLKYIASINLVKAATVAWTAVQWVLDAALNANPIGLVVIAIAALVAIIIVVVTHLDFFKQLWNTVWGFIKDVALAVAHWFAGPFVDFFVAVGQAIAAPFIWLWHNVIEPVWEGIKNTILFVVNILVSISNLLAFLWRETVGKAILWLWHNAVEPAMQGIGAVAMWLWHNVIEPVGHGISVALHAAGDAAMWLWHNAIKPAMDGVAAAINWVWKNVISPVFNAVMDITHKMQEVFRSVFSAIAGFISSSFSNAVGIVKGAINGIIGVINGAISGINSVIGLMNKVPGVNFPHLPTLPKLATGGVLARGGRVVLGEEGAEVVDLPTGAAVYPHGSVPAGGADMSTVEALLARMEALLARVIAAIGDVGGDVGKEINGTGAALRQISRATT